MGQHDFAPNSRVGQQAVFAHLSANSLYHGWSEEPGIPFGKVLISHVKKFFGVCSTPKKINPTCPFSKPFQIQCSQGNETLPWILSHGEVLGSVGGNWTGIGHLRVVPHQS